MFLSKFNIILQNQTRFTVHLNFNRCARSGVAGHWTSASHCAFRLKRHRRKERAMCSGLDSPYVHIHSDTKSRIKPHQIAFKLRVRVLLTACLRAMRNVCALTYETIWNTFNAVRVADVRTTPTKPKSNVSLVWLRIQQHDVRVCVYKYAILTKRHNLMDFLIYDHKTWLKYIYNIECEHQQLYELCVHAHMSHSKST